jgi:hypothetical protein
LEKYFSIAKLTKIIDALRENIRKEHHEDKEGKSKFRGKREDDG